MNKLLVLMVSFTLLLWGAFLWKMSDKVNSGKPAAVENEFSGNEKTLDFKGLLVRLEPQPMPSDDLRDPFRLPKIFMPAPKAARPRVQKDSVVAAAPTPVIAHPQITLDAILPGDNPVAILKYHGESAVVSVGQEIWGVTVELISQEGVTLRFGEEVFKIK